MDVNNIVKIETQDPDLHVQCELNIEQAEVWIKPELVESNGLETSLGDEEHARTQPDSNESDDSCTSLTSKRRCDANMESIPNKRKKKKKDSTDIRIVTISEEERLKEHEASLISCSRMQFVCENCALGYNAEDAYLMHMKMVHSPEVGEHECQICHSRHVTTHSLHKHGLRHYRRYRCTLCLTLYKSRDSAEYHITIDHAAVDGEPFECAHCGKGFKRPHLLQRHMKTEHMNEEHFECPTCKGEFHDRNTYLTHLRSHLEEARVKRTVPTEIQHKCKTCDREFGDQDAYKCHMETHSEENTVCAVCNRRLKSKRALTRHMNRLHSAQVGSQKVSTVCTVCSRTLKTKKSLSRHMSRVHRKAPPVIPQVKTVCAVCNCTLKNEISLTKHMSRVHPNARLVSQDKSKQVQLAVFTPRPRPPPRRARRRRAMLFACPHCERAVSTRAQLTQHVQRIHGDKEKKFQCDYCKRLYFTKSEVKAHIMWSHMRAQGGHACACGRVFRTPSRLREHQERVHSNLPPPKNHTCAECGKGFAYKLLLNRHLRIHSGQTYPCTECGREFKTRDYVKVHYKLSHLNMTRAEIKAQSKRPKPLTIEKGMKLIQHEYYTADTDPLPFESVDVVEQDILETPMFETFASVLIE